MTEEEDEEFQRLEREAKMRRRAEEDDDIQDYKKPWVGLTDAEAESAIAEVGGFAFGLDDGNVSNATVVLYAKAIEATLKAKNT